jgi:glycerol uptake facilitator-like aquaporin
MAFGGVTGMRFAGKQEDAAITPAVDLLYIAFSFGFSLGVNVWVFYRVSGGLFNPAVTLGFVILGLMPPVKGVVLVLAQLVGGIAASGLAAALFPGKLQVLNSLSSKYCHCRISGLLDCNVFDQTVPRSLRAFSLR